jgi:TolA-binding protein
MTTPLAAEANLIDAESFWESKHRNPVLLGLVVLLAIGAAISWWRISINLKTHEAVVAWGAAETPEAKQKVIAAHPGVPLMAFSLLQVADEQFVAKDLAGAQKSYQQFIKDYPQHPLLNAARLGLAGILESQNQSKEAFDLYQQMARQKPVDSYTPLGLLNVARIQLARNEAPAARQSLEDGVAQYSKTPYAEVFRQKIASLPKPN